MWSNFLLDTGTETGLDQEALTESSITFERGKAKTEDDLDWRTSKKTSSTGGEGWDVAMPKRAAILRTWSA